MARRPGFTLVELLVCVALLAVLVAALLPALASARAASLKVVCTARLRDLTIAVNNHRIDTGAFPVQPGASLDSRHLIPALGPLRLAPPKPTDMDPAFLNLLHRYLAFPPLDQWNTTPADLPHVVQCPTVEDADDEARVNPSDFTLARPALYTGFAYCVRPKDGTQVPGVRVLRPARVASPTAGNDSAQSVVWADDVQWSVPELAWRFAHGVPRAEQGPSRLTFAQPRGLLGQHRAYADGSVEWVNGTEVDLDLSGSATAPIDKASIDVFGMFFFWF
jgi:prepilin-type N-terminal cleavage/methylation domain-containing protein